jgi:hypothetical protein
MAAPMIMRMIKPIPTKAAPKLSTKTSWTDSATALHCRERLGSKSVLIGVASAS